MIPRPLALALAVILGPPLLIACALFPPLAGAVIGLGVLGALGARRAGSSGFHLVRERRSKHHTWTTYYTGPNATPGAYQALLDAQRNKEKNP